MKAPIICIRDVTRSYGREPSVVHALRGVSMDIQQSERVALLGKSGSGKSTLLNLIGALDQPSSGTVEVTGLSLSRISSGCASRFRLLSVGLVFQSYNLVGRRTALQNVELPLTFAGLSRKQRRDAARQALDSVGLAHRVGHRPGQLSGGEQQRVAIARALINQPKILLADEPTGNLDSKTAAQIEALILEKTTTQGMTLLVVTHDEDLARRLADRVVHMQDGEIQTA